MSWQAYVDTSLVGSGHIDKGAIISLAGDSTWATSSDFTVEADEMKFLADIFADTNGAKDKAFTEGVHIGKDRYVTAKIEDDGTIYVRKGRTGVAIAKTNQAILIGHHGEEQQAGNASQTVWSLAKYLMELQY